VWDVPAGDEEVKIRRELRAGEIRFDTEHA
jgi:hypothetical protein